MSQIGNLFRWFGGYGKLGNEKEITKTLDSPEMKVLRAMLETQQGVSLHHTVTSAGNLVKVTDNLPGYDYSGTTRRSVDMNKHRSVVSDIFDLADAGCAARLADPPVGVPLIAGLVGDEEAIFSLYFWGLAFFNGIYALWAHPPKSGSSYVYLGLRKGPPPLGEDGSVDLENQGAHLSIEPRKDKPADDLPVVALET
ncbi:MAG: hypothetical protein HYV54_02840 [Parcubacteria group bacterium]|nr:hypothetical protein [Parcubacteria group bacterium]